MLQYLFIRNVLTNDISIFQVCEVSLNLGHSVLTLVCMPLYFKMMYLTRSRPVGLTICTAIIYYFYIEIQLQK